MWKRDQAVRSADADPGTPADSHQQAATPNEWVGPGPHRQKDEIDLVNIGKSVVIKGELNGSEDLTVEGHVEGTIELRENVLIIGPNGNIKAQVIAKSVIVLGTVNGNITAADKVEIRDGGAVDGDIVSPRVVIADGAHFRGRVDMQKKGTKPVLWPASASGQPKAEQPSASVGPQQGQPMAVASAH
jgi:cytoskeletal protein CcmA (bactofilin family)